MNNILLKIFEKIFEIKKVFAIDIGGTTSGGGGTSITFTNPLGSGTTITSLLDTITNYLIFIAAPIAVVMIIYGAFQILTAGGDPKKVQDAKHTIIYACVGLAIVIISKGITSIINQILTGG